MQAEMGGENPLVVLDDADLATAVSVAVNGAFFKTGRCTASSGLIVAEGFPIRFVDAVFERIHALVVDDALKPGTEVGRWSTKTSSTRTSKYVEIGRSEGATLRRWRARSSPETPRASNVTDDFSPRPPATMRINREEIFGPVASVIRVKNYEEALASANERVGLSAGIVPTSIKNASHFKRIGERPCDGQPADRRARLSRAVRRAEEVELRPARAGQYAKEFYTIVKTSYIAP